jgi:hypothetical protein
VERYAVVPPDEEARYCLIKNFLEQEVKKGRVLPQVNSTKVPNYNRKAADDGKTSNRVRTAPLATFLASKTNGWVVKELQLLVASLSVPGVEGSGWEDDIRPPRITKEFEDELVSVGLDRNAQMKLRPNKILERAPSLDIFRFYRERKTAKPELKRVLPSYGFDPDPDPDSDTDTPIDKAARAILELGYERKKRREHAEEEQGFEDEETTRDFEVEKQDDKKKPKDKKRNEQPPQKKPKPRKK